MHKAASRTAPPNTNEDETSWGRLSSGTGKECSARWSTEDGEPAREDATPETTPFEGADDGTLFD
jgi:hypothetical protein